MNATQKIIINLLKSWMKKQYGFEPSKEQFEYISGSIEKEIDLHARRISSHDHNKKLERVIELYIRWYKSTNMIQGKSHLHSGMGFVCWLRKHFYIVFINKDIKNQIRRLFNKSHGV